MTRCLYLFVVLLVVATFLLTGDFNKTHAQKNKNTAQTYECIRNLEDIISSVDENVDMAELSNERIRDVNEIKNKYDAFKFQCYTIMKTKTLSFPKHENCIRKCKDLISDIHMDVNKILMAVDGWSTGG